MRQSYSLSYVSSGTGSFSQGLYLNQMTWQLGSPLRLFLDVGLHTPLQGTGTGSAAAQQGTSFVMPRLGLEWRPTQNTTVMLQYVQIDPRTQEPLSGAWPARF